MTTWYAAPTGVSTNAGTLASPWDLETAATSNAINSGDTVYLRGGRYDYSTYPTVPYSYASYAHSGAISITTNGVTYRNYLAEYPLLDGALNIGRPDGVGGTNTIVRGIRCTRSNPATDPTSGDPLNGGSDAGIQLYGPGAKVISCIADNHYWGGFAMWVPNTSGEMVNCLTYNNGWLDPNYHGTGLASGRAHGMYLQNNTTTKKITDNFNFNNFSVNLYVHTTAQQTRNFLIVGNAVWGAGAAQPSTVGAADAWVGDLDISTGITVDQNHFWNNSGARAESRIQPGGGQNTIIHDPIVWTNNWMNEAPQWFCFAKITATGNRLAAIQGWEIYLDTIHGQVFPTGTVTTYAIDNNAYYLVTDPSNWTYVKGSNTVTQAVNISRSAWQAFGLDVHSTFSASAATGTWSVCRPGTYNDAADTRAHIIVWNWDGLATVAVDVSNTLGLGDTFALYDAYDYPRLFLAPGESAPTPLLTGTYGGGTIPVPLAAIAAPPIVNAVVRNASSPAARSVQFGAFVLIRTAINPIAPGAGSHRWRNPYPGMKSRPTASKK